jgi:hypothetical protein
MKRFVSQVHGGFGLPAPADGVAPGSTSTAHLKWNAPEDRLRIALLRSCLRGWHRAAEEARAPEPDVFADEHWLHPGSFPSVEEVCSAPHRPRGRPVLRVLVVADDLSWDVCCARALSLSTCFVR